MKIKEKRFLIKGMQYVIRSAQTSDADALSKVRFIIDGETEYLDREQGENFIGVNSFTKLIHNDTVNQQNLFLVAVVENKIVGFSRCEGSHLRRFAHKFEFGVAILKDYWDIAIGTNLLKESIAWSDTHGLKKITLNVLEANEKAIKLYQNHGFKIEGILKNDKRLSDGNYYHTVAMGSLVD